MQGQQAHAVAVAVAVAVADYTAAADYAAVAVAAGTSKLARADSAAVEATKVPLNEYSAVIPTKLSLPDCAAVEASTLPQEKLLRSDEQSRKPQTCCPGRSRLPVDALEARYKYAGSPVWRSQLCQRACLEYAHHDSAGVACIHAACPAHIGDHRLIVDQDCRAAVYCSRTGLPNHAFPCLQERMRGGCRCASRR